MEAYSSGWKKKAISLLYSIRTFCIQKKKKKTYFKDNKMISIIKSNTLGKGFRWMVGWMMEGILDLEKLTTNSENKKPV